MGPVHSGAPGLQNCVCYCTVFVQFVFFLHSKMLEPSSNLVALMRDATAIKSQEDNGRRGASTPALWIWFVGLDSCTGTEHVVVSDTNIFPDIPHHGGNFFVEKAWRDHASTSPFLFSEELCQRWQEGSPHQISGRKRLAAKDRVCTDSERTAEY